MPTDTIHRTARRIFVTGSSGFIGENLVRHLDKKGYLVITHDRAAQISSLDLSRIDCIVNLAGRAHVTAENLQNPVDTFRRVNRDFAVDLFKRAQNFAVERFVHISSIGVLGNKTKDGPFTHNSPINPKEPYALSKAETEEALWQIADGSKQSLCIIRPPLVYGSPAKGNFRLLERLVKSRVPLPFGLVNNKRDFISIYNLVDFIETCITHPGARNSTFLVSDAETLSTRRFVELIGGGMKISPILLPVPVMILKSIARLAGKGQQVEKLCGNLEIDISYTKTILGWVPPVSVKDSFNRIYNA